MRAHLSAVADPAPARTSCVAARREVGSTARGRAGAVSCPTEARTGRGLKTSLTKRTVETLKPDLRPWIVWDDRLRGFGVRVQPSRAKTFVVNYRSGSGDWLSRSLDTIDRGDVEARFHRVTERRG